MKINKQISLGLSLVAIATLLSGCGSSQPLPPVNAKDIKIEKLKELYPNLSITQEDINNGNILFVSA